MKVRLWPYKINSAGCKNLQSALQTAGINTLRVHTNGQYRPKASHLIINWGNSGWPQWRGDVYSGRNFLNMPSAVRTAANKLDCLLQLSAYEVNIPTYTTIKGNISQFIEEGKRIYCRTKLTGHSGDGIVVASSIEELVDAPLYTVGIEVRGEYRVHVFRKSDGNLVVIDVQKKRRRNDTVINMDIRNLSGGWVFCHNNVELAADALEQAIQAVSALGLDFGAVDIVIEKRTGKPYVLEVNSAPGLNDSTTINAYVSAIKEYVCQ